MENPGGNTLPPHRKPHCGDQDAPEAQTQCGRPWIILERHNSQPLVFTFKDRRQAMLYCTIQLISLVKITF